MSPLDSASLAFLASSSFGCAMPPPFISSSDPIERAFVLATALRRAEPATPTASYSSSAILGLLRGNHLVRGARKRAGLSQAELAGRAGTTQSVISRLERGATTPSMQTISELVRACGFDLDISLARHDDDHDWSLVQQNLRLSPEQRIQQVTKWAKFVAELRAAGRAAGLRA